MPKKATTEIPRKLLIEEVRRIANILIKVPSMKDYDKYASIGRAVTCEKKFGGWKTFLVAAGFEPNASRITHSTDELKDEFKRIATMLGHTPTTDEFNKLSVGCNQFCPKSVQSVMSAFTSVFLVIGDETGLRHAAKGCFAI